MAGYSGTPLPRKLGISPDSNVLVIGGPTLDLGVHTTPDKAPYDVVLLFCPDRQTLTTHFAQAAAAHTTDGSIWVCWLKKASKIPTDLTEADVREYGLANGRVDVKVAAIDEMWSALKFVIRLSDRQH